VTELKPPARAEGCITDLMFDAWLAADLPANRATELETHVSGCARCARRRAVLLGERAAFLSVAPVLKPAVLVAPTVPVASPRWRAPVAVLLSAAAAVMLVFVGTRQGGHETRAKGTERLGFFVKHGDSIRRGEPGEHVRPGDLLRFTYSTARMGYLTILSLDATGHADVYYPTGPTAQRIHPASDEPLPAAVELDSVLGPERIVALFCEQPIELEPVRSSLERGAAATFRVPERCTRVELVLTKDARIP
jgi:hypothetical protein